jgi:hypothetical protein
VVEKALVEAESHARKFPAEFREDVAGHGVVEGVLGDIL